MTEVRRWLPDLGVGLAIALVGTWMVLATDDYDYEDRLLVTLSVAVAAGLFRRAPGVALGLVWLSCTYQVVSSIDVVFAQLAVGVVAFGAARFGTVTTLWLSGLSIPVGAALGFLYVLARPTAVIDVVGRDLLLRSQLIPARLVLFALGALLFLVVPWLVGLLLRIRSTSHAETEVALAGRQQAERQQLAAEQVAQLRAEQAELARDVHDVVGHSLAVILAQAEAAQFLPDDDVVRVKQTLEAIAGSARESLQDVRQVLASTSDGGVPAGTPVGGIDRLVDGVASAGNDVRSTESGSPRPLPPELELVVYRVLQEMLTNALKHGARGEPISVDRVWHNELRLEVENIVDRGERLLLPGEGIGVPGMRRRLESVGGRLDTHQRERDGVVTWTSTAWIPVRSSADTRVWT